MDKLKIEIAIFYSKNGGNTPAGGNGGDASAINLEMKHLFTAFRFKVQNMRDADITINSVTLNNVCFSKAAEIYFNYPANVTYTGSSNEVIKTQFCYIG